MKRIENWRIWAVLEGLTKTVSRTFQHVVGNASPSLDTTLLSASILGWVQFVVTGVWAKKRKVALLSPVGMFGSMMFGLFALISTVLGFITFMNGGEIATSTFIVTMAIVPGMIIDIIFFKHKTNVREWIGMCIAILGGWVILGSPTSGMSMPLWIWLAICNSITVAINQGISQSIKEVDPMFKNFWGGAVTAIGATTALLIVGQIGLLRYDPSLQKLWLASVAMGFITIAMWSFNLLSYRQGASIALKKLVMNATYLITVMVAGILFFGEVLSWQKLISIPLFCVALVLMDKKIWEFITGGGRK